MVAAVVEVDLVEEEEHLVPKKNASSIFGNILGSARMMSIKKCQMQTVPKDCCDKSR